MNEDYKLGGTYYPQDKMLELTSQGYGTREAKRKIERDNRKKFKKINKSNFK